jgi:hypothetical protein
MQTTSPPPPSGTDPIRFNRIQFGIGLVGMLVILAFAGSSAYDAWRSYRDAVAATNREIGNTAKALAEQTVWTLQAVDLLLVDTAAWYRNESHGSSAGEIDAALATRRANRSIGRGESPRAASTCRTVPISWPSGTGGVRGSMSANRWCRDPRARTWSSCRAGSRTAGAALPASSSLRSTSMG